MHGHGVRTGKDCAGFSIFSLTVAEKQRICCRISMSEPARLPYEAAGECSSILDTGAAADDEVVTYDIHADMDRSLGSAVYAAVLQSRGPLDLAVTAYPYVLDIPGISYHHIRSDAAG